MRRSTAIVDGHGQILHSEGGTLPIYSIAKTFIASAICQSEIDLQTPIAQWIDSDWLPHATDITVEQLLHHSSGLRDYGALKAYADAIEQGKPAWSDEEFAAVTLHQPLLFTPGTSFAYSNPGYWLLRRILEEVHGKGWSEILKSLVIDPLGLADTRVVTGQFATDLPDYPAEWVWHGLIVSSAADTARFMASTLIDPLQKNLYKVPNQSAPWIDPHYGYGLMVEPGQICGHNGNGPGYTASCFHFIQRGLTGSVINAGANEDQTLQQLKDMVAGY
jgi:D-alanyl-D-alanine carboxypeptidase